MPPRFLSRLGRPVVKSIQRGTITVNGSGFPSSNTATITAVDTAHSIVLYGGASWGGADIGQGNVGEMIEATVVLTNATTVTAAAYDTADTTPTLHNVIVEYCVVEFFPGVLRSRGSATMTITGTNLTGTATLSPAVNPAKTMLWCAGWYCVTNLQDPKPRVTLTNSTTITATRASRGGNETTTIAYGYAEFW